MNELLEKLSNRVLEISRLHGSSHIGSCLSILPILIEIYQRKLPHEKFVLSCGHAFLAQAVVMEHYGLGDAEKIYAHHLTHPDRCDTCGLDFSTGSLGHGIGAALGIALAAPDETVYCVISDGECGEGSVWEALRIKTQNNVDNLKVYANINGYTALEEIDRKNLRERLLLFCPDIDVRFTSNTAEYDGVKGHYVTP